MNGAGYAVEIISYLIVVAMVQLKTGSSLQQPDPLILFNLCT
jgi:hypothetical protein